MRLPVVPKKLTVVVDSREKVPVLFPATLTWWADRTRKNYEILIDTKVDTLFAGDYCLEFPEGVRQDRCCTWERKYKVSEIYTNLFTKDWKRASKAFERLCRIAPAEGDLGGRYLLVESSQAEFRKFEREKGLPEGVILGRLIQTACAFGLRLWFAPNHNLPAARRRLGEMMIRVMMGHLFHPCAWTQDQHYSTLWSEKNRHNARNWRS